MHDRGDDQRRVWLLAGTGEGPTLAAALLQRGWQVSVSVVTKPAAQAYADLELEQLNTGPLAGEVGIHRFLQQQAPFDWVLDATHPFAVCISEDLQQVCRQRDQALLRLMRPSETGGEVVLLRELPLLSQQPLSGRHLLLAVGARHLAAAARAGRAAGAEVYGRVLPSADGLRQALAVGLKPDRLAVLRPLQGGSKGGVERALCRRWSISDVLCRQSGGVTEQLWRAISEEQRVRLWLLQQPAAPIGVETVIGVPALLRRLDHGQSFDPPSRADDGSE